MANGHSIRVRPALPSKSKPHSGVRRPSRRQFQAAVGQMSDAIAVVETAFAAMDGEKFGKEAVTLGIGIRRLLDVYSVLDLVVYP